MSMKPGYLIALGAVVSAVVLTQNEKPAPELVETAGVSSAYADDVLTLFLAGDTIIIEAWSHIDDPEFLGLVDEIRAADAAIVNLETPIHEYKGYAQADAGGLHLAAPPEIALELAWAGVDMVSNANNHTFDYGSIGVLETLDNAAKADLKIAGVGPDLQDARAPRYFKTDKGTIALIAASATFHSYNVASNSYPDMRGRPGLNPMGAHEDNFDVVVNITPDVVDAMKGIAASLGRSGNRFNNRRFRIAGLRFEVGEKNEIEIHRRGDYLEEDIQANLASIREAEENADIVVFSIHAHGQGAALRTFARQAIDAGVDVFFGHGPHEVRGIEIYDGKPIFYSLGDFVFQPEKVAHFPAETYMRQGLGPETSLEELRRVRWKHDPILNYPTGRSVWESFAAVLTLSGEQVMELRLIPMDLQYGTTDSKRGQPILADSRLGHSIIEETHQKSLRYGTRIEYLTDMNEGRVHVPRQP